MLSYGVSTALVGKPDSWEMIDREQDDKMLVDPGPDGANVGIYKTLISRYGIVSPGSAPFLTAPLTQGSGPFVDIRNPVNVPARSCDSRSNVRTASKSF